MPPGRDEQLAARHLTTGCSGRRGRAAAEPERYVAGTLSLVRLP